MATFIQWNACSLIAHGSEFKKFLEEIKSNEPDLIMIQETWLYDRQTFKINGYEVERCDRDPGKHGGLATFIKNGIAYTRLINPSNIEAVIVKIKLQSRNLTVVNAYHSPGIQLNPEDYENLFSAFHKDSVILGDLNAHNPLFGGTSSDARGRLLEDLLDKYNMSALNTGAHTRIHYTGSTSSIDLTMASSSIAKSCNWTTYNDTLGSDHIPIIITIDDPAVIEDTSIPRWSLSRADWKGYKNSCRCRFTTDLLTTDINETKNNLVRVIVNTATENIPIMKLSNNTNRRAVPYWTEECTGAVNRRNHARNVMQRTGDINDIINYKKLKGVAQKTIKMAKKNYWRKYCSTLNHQTKIAKVWKTVKKMSGIRGRANIPAITENNQIYDTNQMKAELFAEKFSSYSSNTNLTQEFIQYKTKFEEENHLNSLPSETNENLIINQPFVLHEMTSALRQCKTKTTPGSDSIPYELLKELPRSSQSVLLEFYNQIWKEGKLPDEWKEAVVTPILKPDKSAFDVKSYRPIALTSTLVKVLERMVASRLRWWMESNNNFNRNQTGFRKGRGTIDQIMRLADETHKALNNRQITLAVMIDLEKAFDLVWHEGLLSKARSLGLNGNIINFIESFLKDRKIRVKVGTSISNAYTLDNGTPQGSVISPLLFLIMINDIEPPTNGIKLSLYADDSAAWKSGSNVRTLVSELQNYIDKLVAYFDRWGFKISTGKTTAILFSKYKKDTKDIKLYIHGEQIAINSTVKFLGVVFDQRLTWRPHIENIVARCTKRLNIMKVMSSVNWGASKQLLLTVYKALIRSIIDYGCMAYDTAANSEKAKLDTIQYKALKLCCGATIGTPASALQVECGQPPLALRRLRMQVNYSVKLKSLSTHHPTTSITEESWHDYYGKYSTNRQTFNRKTSSVLKKIKYENKFKESKIAEPWKESEHQNKENVLQPVYNKIRKHILDKWQEMWDYSNTGNFYNEIQPMVGYKLKHTVHDQRRKDVTLTRLRLGHTLLNVDLNRFGIITSPDCVSCHEVEDVKHYLIDCPLQKNLQDKLKNVCRNTSKMYSLNTILREEQCTDIIYDHIIKTNRRI